MGYRQKPRPQRRKRQTFLPPLRQEFFRVTARSGSIHGYYRDKRVADQEAAHYDPPAEVTWASRDAYQIYLLSSLALTLNPAGLPHLEYLKFNDENTAVFQARERGGVTYTEAEANDGKIIYIKGLVGKHLLSGTKRNTGNFIVVLERKD